MSKSYVSMEQHLCEVCGIPFDTGAILLKKDTQPTLERHTITGWGLCPEHQKLADDGYVALVGGDLTRSKLTHKKTVASPGDVHRTGQIIHIKREVFEQVFATVLEKDRVFVFVDSDVIEHLTKMAPPGTEIPTQE